MKSSIPLYNHLALEYDSFFEVPHRKVYDQLSWNLVIAEIGSTPKVIVDAGCGSGRWAHQMVQLGHTVIGIEQAPGMIAAATQMKLGPQFTVIESSLEDVQLPEASVDVVLAMGSLQYTLYPQEIIAKFAYWLKPGGIVCLLYDSLVGMVLELLDVGKTEEALERLASRQGVWVLGEYSADLHLMHSQQVQSYCQQAYLTEIRSYGLLINSSALGKHRLIEQLKQDSSTIMALEQKLSLIPELADTGKQILTIAKKSTMTASGGFHSLSA